jgi:hypothetical protein
MDLDGETKVGFSSPGVRDEHAAEAIRHVPALPVRVRVR